VLRLVVDCVDYRNQIEIFHLLLIDLGLIRVTVVFYGFADQFDGDFVFHNFRLSCCVIEFPNASEEFKRKNQHIFDKGTLGQVLLEPDPPAPSKLEIKTEKELQNQIDGLLRLRHIVAIRSRMDKETSNNLGTPDFLFAIRGRAIAWEIKLPGKKLTEEQRKMMLRLTSNGWSCYVVHSVDVAIELLANLCNASLTVSP